MSQSSLWHSSRGRLMGNVKINRSSKQRLSIVDLDAVRGARAVSLESEPNGVDGPLRCDVQMKSNQGPGPFA